MFPTPYPAAEQPGPTVARAKASAFPLPPVRPQPGSTPTPELDFSAFGNGDVGGTPQGPSGPAPSTPVQGNPFFNFLSSLFGRSGGSAPQGMTGLLAQGQGRRGIDTLGNPFNRF